MCIRVNVAAAGAATIQRLHFSWIQMSVERHGRKRPWVLCVFSRRRASWRNKGIIRLFRSVERPANDLRSPACGCRDAKALHELNASAGTRTKLFHHLKRFCVCLSERCVLVAPNWIDAARQPLSSAYCAGWNELCISSHARHMSNWMLKSREYICSYLEWIKFMF